MVLKRGGETTPEMRNRYASKKSASLLVQGDAIKTFMATKKRMPSSRSKDVNEKLLAKAVSVTKRLYAYVSADLKERLDPILQVPTGGAPLPSLSTLKKQFAKCKDHAAKKKLLRRLQLQFHPDKCQQAGANKLFLWVQQEWNSLTRV